MTTIIVIALSLLLGGLLSIFIFNFFINRKLAGLLRNEELLLATTIMKAFVFLCCGFLVLEINYPFQALIKIWGVYYVNTELFFKEVMYFSVFLGIIILTLFIVFLLALITIGSIVKGKNLFVEVANNNIALAILFGVIFFSFSLIAKTAVPPLLDKFIPYPTMPIYR